MVGADVNVNTVYWCRCWTITYYRQFDRSQHFLVTPVYSSYWADNSCVELLLYILLQSCYT